MIRIGAIGTQSTHTSNFIRICNLDKAFGDEVRITALCGNDDTKEHLEEVAKKGEISEIYENDINDAMISNNIFHLYSSYVLHIHGEGFLDFCE